MIANADTPLRPDSGMSGAQKAGSQTARRQQSGRERLCGRHLGLAWLGQDVAGSRYAERVALLGFFFLWPGVGGKGELRGGTAGRGGAVERKIGGVMVSKGDRCTKGVGGGKRERAETGGRRGCACVAGL